MTFRHYLQEQRDDHTPAGKFASWALRFEDFPTEETLDVQLYRDWTRQKMLGDGRDDVLRRAFGEYVLERQRRRRGS